MDNYDLFHSKRFSVGLNMENSQEDILTFLEEYKDMLSSIYFSFPLGRKFIQEPNWKMNMIYQLQRRN